MSPEAKRTARLDREIVAELIDSGAVNFQAIGAAVAKFGPSVALDGWGDDWFCGTMRLFIRIYRLPGPVGPLADIGALREQIGQELRG
ncbi:MAG TPA: hypothetical protein VIK38_13370, partial [Coriobacteriia bacterium]|jgi:hypothetical protein